MKMMQVKPEHSLFNIGVCGLLRGGDELEGGGVESVADLKHSVSGVSGRQHFRK